MNELQEFDEILIDVNIATMDPEISGAYGAIENAALAIKDGKIAWLGKYEALPKIDALSTPVTSAKGKWLTPGLIDCHTHVVFGGSRAREFEMRLEGVSYQEIAAQGGGIV